MQNLSDGQMYMLRLRQWLRVTKNQIEALEGAMDADHQGLTERCMENVSTACDYVVMIVKEISQDCDEMNKYWQEQLRRRDAGGSQDED